MRMSRAGLAVAVLATLYVRRTDRRALPQPADLVTLSLGTVEIRATTLSNDRLPARKSCMPHVISCDVLLKVAWAATV